MGKKLPEVKLLRPGWGSPGISPNKTIAPNPMNARIATTLIIANQYSNSPKLPTPVAFKPTSSSENSTIHAQGGTCGNHQRQ